MERNVLTIVLYRVQGKTANVMKLCAFCVKYNCVSDRYTGTVYVPRSKIKTPKRKQLFTVGCKIMRKQAY